MNNTKLVQEAKLNPTRIYQRPHDVLRDRRLRDTDRLVILTAWVEAQRHDVAVDRLPQANAPLQELEAAWHEVNERLQTRVATE
jgi:hypothetical protein